jgi:general secretion pathway protein K
MQQVDYFNKNQQKTVFSKNETGIAMFLVLWVLTLLSVIVGEFCHAMRTEVNITRNFKEETEAYYIALAGMNSAVSELIKNENAPQKPENSDKEKEDKIEWRVNADIPAIPFGAGQFKVEIGNESGKININKAGESLLRMMTEFFEIEDSEKAVIADSILDWRDQDSLHRLNGAEDDYYLSLPKPYPCKDVDFDAVEELLLVKGITAEIYEVLKEIVTVLDTGEAEPEAGNRGSDSDKININAASPEMLLSLPGMTEDMVSEIIEYRKEKDFKSQSELYPIVGDEVYTAILPYLAYPASISSFFTVRSVGMLNDSLTRQSVKVLVKIDPRLPKKYRIVEWIED